MEVGADEMRLRQCEHALREGFHAFIEEIRGKKVTAAPPKMVSAAFPRKVSVELRRISRSRPGPVRDESMLTSFSH
ncbi:uncharacterized protein LAESUDRAFT_729891 [Laetiporus sulphureus 93-53]|uniref:Uncharacterized protein n=1 Tax=Laetiporus sulphureus 93-53 TaxID=1314785 RepID=A0A165CE55_9APHY|nr:uncharacterized protein LAESUDRAFT_729891 [Laetiporus sulphureus 93-53]KZT02650.1 hypothetical protein LAESUDRAFT_729891 [Laetiporus sulphureus 93-53]